MNQPAWLKTRSKASGIDWGFIAYWALILLFVGYSAQMLGVWVRYYLAQPADLFADAGLYFRATEAWLAGGNPWAVTAQHGVRFAGPPTTLLANLLLQPFGPDAALWFWPIAGAAGWLITMRRLVLGPWWILFPPFVEALLAGSPDPALMGLIVVGGGAITAVLKPYAVPAMMAEGRWRSVVVAGIVLVASALFLPWGLFVSELDTIRDAFAQWSINSSAWGQPLLMIATAAGLVVLGPKLGLLMATPGLWPGAQLHYSIFSARAGAKSAFLALVLAIPGAAPYGIITYAVAVKVMPSASKRLQAGAAVASATDGSEP